MENPSSSRGRWGGGMLGGRNAKEGARDWQGIPRWSAPAVMDEDGFDGGR